ncbi:hypothetical protein [Kineococcus sp. R86509]|uniref:hypothetical protein n=1 Tax=Kineococcus sp. R86509 TaxID=3093851 RepID=UPI0036D41C78
MPPLSRRLLLAFASTAVFSSFAAPGAAQAATPRLRLGLMGGFAPGQLRAVASAGVERTLLEVRWDLAQPAEGRFDQDYLAGIRDEAVAMRAAGLTVSLNTGLMDAPAWFLAKPGARYKNSAGREYTDLPIPNLVFGIKHRPFVQSYLNGLFAAIGKDFDLVRVGGGIMGELSYPYEIAADGSARYDWWAFDSAAMTHNPVRNWRPGQPSPNREASRFLTWYLNSLVTSQNWQISSLRRAGYAGDVAVLYPSYGMRPGDAAAAAAGNLAGGTSPEVNGEIQRGYDFARQIAGLKDSRAVVYGTWGDDPRPVSYLAGLARRYGRRMMAENGGGCGVEAICRGVLTAVENGLDTYWVVRAGDVLGSATTSGAWERLISTWRSVR